MEDEGKKYWLSIAAFVLVFIAVVVTLSTFMQQTSNRIVAQANQYVSDATAQSCVLVSTLMENTQRDIETIAALASESADVTDIVTSEEWLISVEETSPFDTIDFVDVDGMQHSPQARAGERVGSLLLQAGHGGRIWHRGRIQHPHDP